MALFDDVPPPKKGYFKKKGKDGMAENGSDGGSSPMPKAKKENPSSKGGHNAQVNFAEGPPPAAMK